MELQGTHRLGILPIEIDEERVKTNPKNWRNERGKPCVISEGHDFKKVEGTTKKGDVVLHICQVVVHGSEKLIILKDLEEVFLCAGYSSLKGFAL